ncbi:hypothetical protein DFH09DRAFT_1134322 [Mycena vulgaris]|nr:hypothetical protein DFH09DRAFT_1134322 [Mycena vulgaris]
MPPRFVEIKRAIAAQNPNFEQNLSKAWTEVLAELEQVTKTIAKEGSAYIPQVSFADLDKSSEAQIADIKRKGTVVIRDVVDDAQAQGWDLPLPQWRDSFEEFIKANPQAEGFPEDDKQFFYYWTMAQVQARAHPSVLAAATWLNGLYRVKFGRAPEGVDLATPLSYADRFRIRHLGVSWGYHPPHVDGGAIERWEDENSRACFADILSGAWMKHDPYALEPGLEARTLSQSSVFRTFQGWLALSKTGPQQGTLKLPRRAPFECILNPPPVFRPLVPANSEDILDAKNWEFDISTPDFPGIFVGENDSRFSGPHPTNELHPHLVLDMTMTPVPAVNPGDTVFWHCDVVHSVEQEHTGSEDSAGVPGPANARYVARQKEEFLKGLPPPDFPVTIAGVGFIGLGKDQDVEGPGRKAMGLPISVA